jgi:hypothetical protein
MNLRAEPHTQYELIYSHQQTDFDSSDLPAPDINTGVNVDYLQLGGIVMGDGNIARPYLVATVGATRFDPDDAAFNSDIFFSFSIGGGMKMWPKERFGLRLEGRFYGTVLDSDSYIFCKSDSDGAACLIQTSSEVLWQWEMMAGAVFRF